MNLDHAACYSALLSRDSRFDGRFFVGVSSTGIYCRPICRVKPPKAANAHFFPSAAAAEKAGYRPCLRCRPEIAPGYAAMDSAQSLAFAAKELIDKGLLDKHSAEYLAQRIGVTSRYLRCVFQQVFGVSPSEYNQSRRLLLAKQLLTDTQLSLSDVAAAAGFSSQQRFHVSFKSQYRLPPLRFRKQNAAVCADHFDLELGYRPPYAWSRLLAFLDSRAITGVEAVSEDRYRRVIQIPGTDQAGWIEVRHLPSKERLGVRVSHGLLPQLSWLRNRLCHALDLSQNPAEIAAVFTAVPDWCAGLRIPGCIDSFEIAVRAILGQQITVAAASTLLQRFVERFGAAIDTPWPGLLRAFPSPAVVAEIPQERIAELGIIRQRAQAILSLAEQAQHDPLLLEPGLDPEQQIARLQALPGIGPWTAHYIALRGLAWSDAFPATDAGVLNALAAQLGQRPGQREVNALAQTWRPWRGYMTLHLWQRLADQGKTP